MTFQVTNLNTNKISEFANRAQFLYEMEQIETRHLATNTMGRYKLTHLNAKTNEVLEEKTVEIPPTEGDLEQSLKDFGLATEGGGLFSRRKPKQALKVPPQSVSEPEESNPVNIDEDEQSAPISDTKTNFPTSNNVVPSSSYTGSKLNIVSFGKIVAWLVVLFLALYGAGVSHTIAVGLKSGAIKTTQSTPKQTSTVSDMSDEHEVDVFSRYFIGAYLTNSDLDNFISSKVSNKPFDKVTTTAVLLEKAQTKDKQTYEMTYVVSYNKDDKTKSSRFKFTVKKAKKAMYGYEVTKLPKESDYPG